MFNFQPTRVYRAVARVDTSTNRGISGGDVKDVPIGIAGLSQKISICGARYSHAYHVWSTNSDSLRLSARREAGQGLLSVMGSPGCDALRFPTSAYPFASIC
jgi:hypothetical protein